VNGQEGEVWYTFLVHAWFPPVFLSESERGRY